MYTQFFAVHSNIGHEMRIHFERLVGWYGRKQFIPGCIEDNIIIFYQMIEVRSTETNILTGRQTSMAEQDARKSNDNSEHDWAPIGVDITPLEVPLEDVEMMNDENQCNQKFPWQVEPHESHQSRETRT